LCHVVQAQPIKSGPILEQAMVMPIGKTRMASGEK
jgi:hypothetical protein